ncbi:MAG: hypothetical protein AB1568_11660 [Thermodesulfobacteriota bacterium]
MALDISNSLQVTTTPLASPADGRSDAFKANRNLERAQTDEQQAVQRRREAQAEMQQAEQRLQQARQKEQAAAQQVRAAQAERQQTMRSRTQPSGGEIISITV